MLLSSKIIRDCDTSAEEPVFLALRYEFPPLPLSGDDPREEYAGGNGHGNGAGRAGSRGFEDRATGSGGNGRAQPGPLEEAGARAEEILAAARREAAAILEKAREEAGRLAGEAAARGREEGLAAGREEGYREGYRKALEEAAAEAGALREEARQVLRQAEEIRRATLAGLEGEVVALAREMAEKIVAAQLTLDPAVVLNIVHEALETARAREQAVLYVNPEQMAMVEERRQELEPALPPGTVLQIIGDPAVEPGGCRVETADGRVDASLKARWQALQEALQ